MKKSYVFLSLAVLILLAGLLVYGRFLNPASFDVMKAKKDTVYEAVYGLGEVKSDSVYEFKGGAIQNIEALFVQEGDSVKKGDPLFKLTGGQVYTSPLTGTVTDLPFHESENVPVGLLLIQIQDFKDTFIEMSLEQEGALRVQAGQKARISFESLRGEIYEGKVESLFSKKGSFLVRIGFAGLNKAVLPGMTADVAIEIGKKENALLVPLAAIDNGAVTIRREGKAQKVKVQLGYTDNRWAEVVSGDVTLEDEILVPQIKKRRK